MKCKKLKRPTRATLGNLQFSLCGLGKKIEVSLRSTFKNPNFESKDELKNTKFKFEFHC